jgi:hypothetical protein
MKAFDAIVFDRSVCLTELQEFKTLLDVNVELNEQRQILPFFKKHKQLSALLGTYNPKNLRKNAIAHELELFGDFACDLAVGDSLSHAYCLVEFEDASRKSLFVDKGRHHPEWSPRFEHGFGQLVDWMWRVSDEKQTETFRTLFGESEANIVPLLVIGRSSFMNLAAAKRFRWRNRHVQLMGAPTTCLTYDELYEELLFKIQDVMPLATAKADAAMTKATD